MEAPQLARRPTKGKRSREMHPLNKHADRAPDFGLLASLYPEFAAFVSVDGKGKPRIDWTDFNATRELTRVLLQHDYGVKWWISDGQLCPTVPNRANYIHWIEDLLNLCPAPWHGDGDPDIRGLDIGTGANCIYPLLGAALHGWHFVGTDFTPVAIESARRIVEDNPHLAEFIEVRQVHVPKKSAEEDGGRPPVLLGVVGEDEEFDFCMCNPPFFKDMSEASANPWTACGGTVEEMVCDGGEAEFIRQIIDDSAVLRDRIQWYSSMVGRKANLKMLTARLRSIGVTMLRTTEFVQGRTSRWGIAWSFGSSSQVVADVKLSVRKHNTSFMLEKLGREWTAAKVLDTIVSVMRDLGASCTVDVPSLCVTVRSLSGRTGGTDLVCPRKKRSRECFENSWIADCLSDGSSVQTTELCFKATVYQQAPGSLVIVASVPGGESNISGQFSVFFEQVGRRLRSIVGTTSGTQTQARILQPSLST